MQMDDPETRRARIADRLRTARELAGLSQGQVSRLIGLHRPSISEIEAGRRRVASEELTQFAAIYQVDIAWLAGETRSHTEITDKVELAARELAKIAPEDLDTLLDLLAAIRAGSNK